ncbi:MAG: hypothetical protein NZM29_07835, partial [Nitrospira sp.]|nr:hypothetical protein [Nitrospira sp.]
PIVMRGASEAWLAACPKGTVKPPPSIVIINARIQSDMCDGDNVLSAALCWNLTVNSTTSRYQSMAFCPENPEVQPYDDREGGNP